MEINRKSCNCENKGYLETYCSNEALIKSFKEKFDLENLSFNNFLETLEN